jgi:hypothetical protein
MNAASKTLAETAPKIPITVRERTKSRDRAIQILMDMFISITVRVVCQALQQ